MYVKTAINDKSIDISIAHTEEDLTNNHFFFLILQVDNGKISFIKRFNDHTHSINLGNYRNPSTEQYIEAVKYVSTEVVAMSIAYGISLSELGCSNSYLEESDIDYALLNRVEITD